MPRLALDVGVPPEQDVQLVLQALHPLERHAVLLSRPGELLLDVGACGGGGQEAGREEDQGESRCLASHVGCGDVRTEPVRGSP